MSHTHLALFAALVALPLAAPAQTKAPPASDSTSADSAATQPKKSRFGGIMNKAKQVAGNKSVQAAAKNVACTAVPGAAVATAVSGQGPCVGAGIAGLIPGGGGAGGVKGAVSGAISGGVAGAVGAKAMTAMGGMGGMGDISAIQGMMKKGGALKGMSDATSAALIQQMMVQSAASKGLSAAASTAAMQEMLKKNGALTGMSNAQSAALVQQMMLQTAQMNAMVNAAAGSAAIPVGATAAAMPTPAARANYDFVPGQRVIFYSDFTDEQIGNFPAKLQFVEGNMDVAELGGRRVLRATGLSKLTIPLSEVLPQRFTIEIDVINRPSLDGADFHLRGSVGRIDDSKTSIIGWGSDGVVLLGGGGGEVKASQSETMRARYRGKPAQLRILGDGKYVKVFLDEKRLANVPNANFDRSNVLHLVISAVSEENPAYISRIRVAELRR